MLKLFIILFVVLGLIVNNGSELPDVMTKSIEQTYGIDKNKNKDKVIALEKLNNSLVLFSKGKFDSGEEGLRAIINFKDRNQKSVLIYSDNMKITSTKLKFSDKNKNEKIIVFGYINDPQIEKVKIKNFIDDNNFELISANLIETDSFRIWVNELEVNDYKYEIHGYDKKGKEIYHISETKHCLY